MKSLFAEAMNHRTKIAAGILVPAIYFHEQSNYIINKLLQTKGDIIFENHVVRKKPAGMEILYDDTPADHIKCFCVKCQEENKGRMNGQASIVRSNYGVCEHNQSKRWTHDSFGCTHESSKSIERFSKELFDEEPNGVMRLSLYFRYGDGLSKGLSNYSWIGMDGDDYSFKDLRQSYCQKHIPDMIKDIESLKNLQ